MADDMAEILVRKFNHWLFGIKSLSHDLRKIDLMRPSIEVKYFNPSLSVDIKKYIDSISSEMLHEIYWKVSPYRQKIIGELGQECAILYLVVCSFYIKELNITRFVIGHEHVEPNKENCLILCHDLILTYTHQSYD